MRNRAHRKLVHVHSIKEHARKSRFTSIQKLQNFKNATVNRGREDRQNPEYNRRKRQGVSETPEIGSKTQLGLGRLDPFESLPINSRRVSFLLSSGESEDTQLRMPEYLMRWLRSRSTRNGAPVQLGRHRFT